MSKWDKISLFKFQQINAINDNKGMSDIDKTLFSTCVIFDMTEYQLDNTGMKKAAKLIKKTELIFTTPLKPGAQKRIGKYIVNYDPSSLTFGQYIELSFFFQSYILSAHYALASITRKPFSKYNTEGHRRRADYFLHQPIEKVMGALSVFIENFKAFNNEYKGLFGLDKEVNGEDAQSDKFNKWYGWIYSADQVAEYERIKLEEAFALPIRQALNDLSYLKAKGQYEAEQQKKLSAKLKNNNNE